MEAHAAVAQLAARRSHNPKVGSSILSCRILHNADKQTEPHHTETKQPETKMDRGGDERWWFGDKLGKKQLTPKTSANTGAKNHPKQQQQRTSPTRTDKREIAQRGFDPRTFGL
jgi:hypothetical protein